VSKRFRQEHPRIGDLPDLPELRVPDLQKAFPGSEFCNARDMQLLALHSLTPKAAVQALTELGVVRTRLRMQRRFTRRRIAPARIVSRFLRVGARIGHSGV